MASNSTRRRPGGGEETYVEHKEAGEAWVPTRLLDHYKARGWKPAKATESTASRPTSTAPEGA